MSIKSPDLGISIESVSSLTTSLLVTRANKYNEINNMKQVDLIVVFELNRKVYRSQFFLAILRYYCILKRNVEGNKAHNKDRAEIDIFVVLSSVSYHSLADILHLQIQ